MPRQAKGPRLYLREGRVHPRTGKPIPDVWYIRDGSAQVSTGCARDERGGPDGAEAKLAAYITQKWAEKAPAAATRSPGDPAGIFVAEVLAFYLAKRAPKLARPADTSSRVRILGEWWGDKRLAEVKLSTCEAYIAHRAGQVIRSFKSDAAAPRNCSEQGARRELEDLSAAIGFYAKEHRLNWRPPVSLPTKSEGSKDALSRPQAAALLWAALGHRKDDEGRWAPIPGSARANRAHMRRFILIGLYTGTRPGVIPKVLWHDSATQAHADLDDGIIYRRGKRERDHANKRRPLVKLPPRLITHMRRWKRLDDAASARAAEAARKAGQDPPDPLSIVLHHGGAPIQKVRTSWESCVADAGLPDEVTPHWLRHTAATWLLRSKVDPYMASEYLGMTVDVLLNTYAHIMPDHQSAARKAAGGKR